MPTPNVDGLDVSHWNVVTDEAAILPYRLMSCKATEGRSGVSNKFSYFWRLFGDRQTRHRGAYHWVRSDSTMRLQVDHLDRTISNAGGLQVGDFVQLDWETTPNIPNMTVGQIEEWVGIAHARFGERVIVYGSDWVPDFLRWRKANPTIPVWYANYNTGTSATGGWAEAAKYQAAVWQWTSTFKAPGFLWNPNNPTDGVDANHVFDWATLDRLTLRDTVIPVPVPIPGPIGEPMTPYLFRLSNGGLGVRDVTGARSLNGGELEGPYAGERVYDVPAGSPWEHWINRELAKYVRELDAPPPVQVTVPPVTVKFPSTFAGTIGP